MFIVFVIVAAFAEEVLNAGHPWVACGLIVAGVLGCLADSFWDR